MEKFEGKYNTKSTGVKRLMREACELREPTEDYCAHPLGDNLFEWHFTVKGQPGSEFEGGFYHGRILLPTEYPMKPPNIILLTPNGRFEVNKKICLSISDYHPETWQPSWSIRTALLALQAFMTTRGLGTVGSVDFTAEERRALALKSLTWKCTECGLISTKLANGVAKPITEEEKSLIECVALKGEEPGEKATSSKSHGASTAGAGVTETGGVPETGSQLRQRTVTSSDAITDAEADARPHADVAPQIVGSVPQLEAAMTPGFVDRYNSFIIGFLLTAIALLVLRRAFLL